MRGYLKFICIAIMLIGIWGWSWTNYFGGDDWYHLRLVQIHSLREFVNFFSFTPTDQTASFYRPLSTQVFFFVFYRLFGLWAMPWYVFTTAMLGLSVWLVYMVAKKLIFNFQFVFFNHEEKHQAISFVPNTTSPSFFNEGDVEKFALVSALIYCLSVTHFTHQYFLSTFQEIGMVIGVLLAFLNYLDGKKWRMIYWWIVALLCKETGVVFVGLLGLYELILNSKIHTKGNILSCSQYFTWKIKIPYIWSGKLLLVLLVLMVYLYLRFGMFVGVGGDSYVWSGSIIKFFNTLMWYCLWALGVPEMVVDFVGSGLVPIPRFYTVFGNWWMAIVTELFVVSAGLLVSMYRLFLGDLIHNLKFKIQNFGKYTPSISPHFRAMSQTHVFLLLFCGGWFVVSLGPVLFLPWHKFTLELGLPMVGFVMWMAYLVIRSGKLGTVLLISFITFNLSMNYLTYQHHYSVSRPRISQQVETYFVTRYPVWPDTQVWIVNDSNENQGEWGGDSVQIAHSVNGSEMFRVIYGDPSIKVYFQGIDDMAEMKQDAEIVRGREILQK